MRHISKLCLRSVGKCSTRGVIECQSPRGAWASTRGCGARHATRTRVPSSAGRRAGGAAYSELWGHGAVSGERGGESSRGGEDAGAHARHMRRRTLSGLCQLTFPPRPISRVSSASLPSLAASNTALPIAALELPEPICSARSWRRVLWLRERVGRRVSLTRNRRKSQAPEAPKVRSMPRGRFDGHRPGSRVGREGQRARPTRASANTSTPWRHSHVPLDPARAHSNGLKQDRPFFLSRKKGRKLVRPD